MVKRAIFGYYLSIFMSRKTLIISLVYYPEFVGGAEVAVNEITGRIKDNSFDMITLIGSSKKRFEKVGNVNIFRVGFSVNHSRKFGKILFNLQKYLFPFLVFLKGSSLHKKNNYNVFWSVMANYAGFGALFLKLRFPKVKFLLTLQEGDPISYIKKRVFFVYWLFKMIFKKADHVQTISSYLSDFAKSMKSKKVTVVPNGVDVKKFTTNSSEEEKSILKEKFNIESGDIVLVTTSRLVIKNGIEDVIKTFSFLPSNYKFLVIGDGELKNNLKSLVSNLGLSDRIFFIGFVDQDKIPLYFSISDIFIRTSLSEGLGNSFLEAMAFGLPVVATPVGGIIDFIETSENGIFVKPKDIKSIKEGILRLENQELKNRIISNANKLVYDKYDWDKISTDFNYILKNI